MRSEARLIGLILALGMIVTAGMSIAAGKDASDTGVATKAGSVSNMKGVGTAGEKTKAVENLSSPQEGALHGGEWNPAGGRNYETVFSSDGIRVYLYNGDRSPAMVEGATGRVSVRLSDGETADVALTSEVPAAGESAVYFCPMHTDVVQMKPGVCEKCGGMTLYTQNRLSGKIDLSQAKPGAITADITIRGLPGKIKETTYAVSNAHARGGATGKPHGKVRGKLRKVPETLYEPGTKHTQEKEPAK